MSQKFLDTPDFLRASRHHARCDLCNEYGERAYVGCGHGVCRSCFAGLSACARCKEAETADIGEQLAKQVVADRKHK